MDKYEYKVRAEEIKALIAEGEFAEAVKIADTIDWRRVKSVMMLCTISDLYKINRRFQESKDILLMAYERHPGGRLIVYSLCELSIKMGEFVQAIEYYKEFVQIAPKDTGRYILQYKLYEAQDVSLEERIAVLEEFKKRDYREKWAYELAYLYHRVGLETKCVEECDEMILWFGEGRYVMKALELKMLHQPLSAAQQEKYLLMKQEMEQMAEEEAREEESAAEEAAEDNTVQEEQSAEAGSEILSEETQEEEEEDFKVKTVDLGQYNTINLQQALAESMKEILGEEEQEEAEPSTMGPITESIVAPLLQETGDIPVVQPVDFPVIEEITQEPAYVAQEQPVMEEPVVEKSITEEPVQIPEPPIATEEVFFEEDIKDILLEDTKEINVGIGIGDTKEIHPKKRVIYPSVTPAQASVQKTIAPAASVQTAAEMPLPVQETGASVVTPHTAAVPPTEPIQAQGPNLIKPMKPSGFEQMLSQEYDGQISLVVPNRSDVEKQITGQMNITDIMAEWERMKRENEEKRKEDIRKRVEQQTGNLFSDFDEATKTGLLEQMEKIAAEAAEKVDTNKKEAAVEKTDIGKQEAAVEKMDTDKQEAAVEKMDTDKQEAAVEKMDTDKMVVQQLTDIMKDTEEEEIKKADTIIQLEEDEVESEDEIEKRPEKIKEDPTASAQEEHKVRAFSEEEKELFGRFAHNRKAKEQIIHAIDTISMDSYSGNVIITGEEEAGTLDVAKNLVRMLQMTDRNFSGKVAKISGDTLNKKDVQATLAKLVDGALIIEHATEMSSGTSTDLSKALAKENQGIFVIMEGKKDEMNIFLRKNNVLMNNFNGRIDIESLDDQALVEYAKQYAEEMEYSIDELGILALHTRIADMQTSDHEVTVAEVRDLVDDAIYFADKKNPKHFFDILFGKRYDEEDMIILREKDFMHY